MKQDSQQEHSLKKSIEILAEITRKDIQKSYKIENFSNIEATYTDRYGWTLRKKSVLLQDK
tara:strand:+ start:1092 stop:1274 length:183 start_codon:yes stop_codon:yes gene_type:complete